MTQDLQKEKKKIALIGFGVGLLLGIGSYSMYTQPQKAEMSIESDANKADSEENNSIWGRYVDNETQEEKDSGQSEQEEYADKTRKVFTREFLEEFGGVSYVFEYGMSLDTVTFEGCPSEAEKFGEFLDKKYYPRIAFLLTSDGKGGDLLSESGVASIRQRFRFVYDPSNKYYHYDIHLDDVAFALYENGVEIAIPNQVITDAEGDRFSLPEDLKYRAILGTMLEGMFHATRAFLDLKEARIGDFLREAKKDCKVNLQLSVYKNRKE